MTVHKVDFKKWEIQKDPGGVHNAYAWTGLTLGKLMAIAKALESHQGNPVAYDCWVLASRAVEAKARAALKLAQEDTDA